MSYNIDSVTCTALDAYMFVTDIRKLHKELEDEMAECNFLDDLFNELDDGQKHKPDERIPLKNLWWYGEFSGNSFETLVKKIAPRIHGEVQAIFTWEGGDSHSGLYIKDGKVKECDVELRLVIPEDSKD